MANPNKPGPAPAGLYTVGVTDDFTRVTVNIPVDDGPATPHPAFTLLFTAEQADAFAEVLKKAAGIVRVRRGN